MAKQRTAEFDEWCGGASEEEVKKMAWKQRGLILLYMALWFVSLIVLLAIGGTTESWGLAVGVYAVLGGYFMGCMIFCYNNLCILQSRGNKNGSDAARGILMLAGLLIVPIIVVRVAAKNAGFGHFICKI